MNTKKYLLIIVFTLIVDRHALSNYVIPYQTPGRKWIYDQGLHCLPLIQLSLNISTGTKIGLLKFKEKYVNVPHENGLVKI